MTNYLGTILLGDLVALIGGLIIGSFLNVLILRLPKGETLGGRSHCMRCKHELAAKDLVPILSFIFLMGRCRYCGKKISRRYFYVELFTGLLFAFSFARLAPSLDPFSIILFAKALFVCALMLTIFMIDFEHFLILDKVLIWAGAILIVLNLALDFAHPVYWVNSNTFNGLLGGMGLYLFFGAVYYLSRGRWLGFGDVKFALVFGLALPFPIVVVGIMAAFGIGALVAIILLALQAKRISSEVPFGTFLAVGALVAFFYGEKIWHWYLALMGLRYLA